MISFWLSKFAAEALIMLAALAIGALLVVIGVAFDHLKRRKKK
jgi:hypothetical protein